MLIIAIFLGLIPAFIARNKGRNFWAWYVYGVLLFIVALIHSLCLRDASASRSPEVQREALLGSSQPDMDACIAKLDDADAAVREEAADALGEMGVAAQKARPALLALRSDPDHRVRARAGWALSRIGKGDTGAETD